MAIALLGSLSLTSCAWTGAGTPSDGGCVPLVTVQPQTITAGDTLAVTIEGGCNLDTPDDGWVIVAAPVGNLQAAIRTTIDTDLADGLDVELQLPSDFPAGEAFAGVDHWDYSACPDNASCAAPMSDFEVLASG